MGFLNKLFGDPNERVITSLQPIINKINELGSVYEAMSNEELQAMTIKFRERLGIKIEEGVLKNTLSITEEKKILDEILPEAFAVLREASKRTIGQRHYDVQLVGGLILHRGQISEMKTGEGKTLVATLPLYLNALAGRGVHLVTVNDYLSRVGAGWMAPVYHALGMTTSVIVHEKAYAYDPEYIDETQFDDRLKNFKQITRQEAYRCDVTYGTNNEFGFDYLKDNMVGKIEQMVQRPLYYSIVDEVDSILIDEARTPLIISAQAEESTSKYYEFAKLVERLVEDEDYNVDEKLRAATLTEAGIAKMEDWMGVENIYVAGGVREVHHIEQALKARVLFKADKDYVVKDGEVLIVDEFTGRLMHGRRYSEGLHQAIEAKEGVKIQRESMTMATVTFQNYFRMYTKLAGMTGTALTEAEEFHKIYNLEVVSIPTNKPIRRKDLNDLIYSSEKGKFEAVIKEIKERTAIGQPVLVGTISIEKNELLVSMLEYAGVKAELLNAKNHEKEAQVIAQAGKAGSVTIATNMAGRGVDIILGGSPFNQEEYDKVIALGGLHVIGTERHESRRIDNQLRGRAGRQGDAGSSQFYISMDDDLMRIFGGDRIRGLMKTLRLPEDTPIENKLISRSLESAQKKVEGNNFDIRKHLVEYDDVINRHREAIYARRREILKIYNGEITNKNLSELILETIDSEIENLIAFHTTSEELKDWNTKDIAQAVNNIFTINIPVIEEKIKDLAFENNSADYVVIRTKIFDYLSELARNNYANLLDSAKTAGIEWREIEKSILIRSIDNMWVEHLELIDYMRRGIGLRSYGQRDPLVEYKKEAFHLFNDLISLINKEVAYSIFKIANTAEMAASQVVKLADEAKKNIKEVHNSASVFGKEEKNQVEQVIHGKTKDAEGNKVNRNDLCVCGSGKKFKKCCGK